MTRLEAIQAWLREWHHARNWVAEEIPVYANDLVGENIGTEPVLTVVGLKPAMIAMPHPVWVSENAIYQRWASENAFGQQYLFKDPRSIKIDIGSPKFFKVLLRAMKGEIRRSQA